MRELSALFAHIAKESAGNGGNDGFMNGLATMEDEACEYPKPACVNDDTDAKYLATPDQEYYARGPLGITGSRAYGMFGDSFGPISYDGKSRFLDNPDDVLADSYVAFASAIWFYMTPDKKKPSMHDIMTHYWMPNGTDTGANVDLGFGATIAVIAHEECGNDAGGQKR
jgi:hypothetical protein